MATAKIVTPSRSRRRTAPPISDHRRPIIWGEVLWGLDWLSLRLSPVYVGLGVPRGDGGPVVLVPGFLTTDVYLAELYFWLRRIGYRPFTSGIGINADCIHVLTKRLEKTVVAAYNETGRPVRIIGHSLGGFLARRVAVQRPEIVCQLISLGAPIKSLEAHPAIMAAARLIRGQVRHLWNAGPDLPTGGQAPGFWPSGRCECEADHCVVSPPPSIQRAALYSRTDGAIDWRHCLEPDPSLNHDVGGTHIGLVFNPRSYRVIGNLLAQVPAESHRPAA